MEKPTPAPWGVSQEKKKIKSPGRHQPNCQRPNKKLHEFSISNITLPGLSKYRPSIRIVKGFCISLNDFQRPKQKPLRNSCLLRKVAAVGSNPVRGKIAISFPSPFLRWKASHASTINTFLRPQLEKGPRGDGRDGVTRGPC